jgi:thiol-disulfide isomerase/thioredoxin
MRNSDQKRRFYILRFVKMITEIIVSLIVVIGFIGIYYAVTGTPPGARIIEQEPPTSSGLDDNQANFMFFYATWCPHCKTAQQPWHSLKQFIKNSGYSYGGKTVSFEEVNAETDKGKSALYSIMSYPTFKVQTKDKIYEMVGKPSVTNFREFLKKALGDEKPSH